jgi:Fe-S cluster assembly protein SufD
MMSVAVPEKNTTSQVASIVENSLSPSTPALELRKSALESFRKLGLPPAKAEEYKFTPITRILEKNFNFTLTNPQPQNLSIRDFEIQKLHANVLVFINGVFSKDSSSVTSAGIKITSLKDELHSNSETLTKHLGKYADAASDSLVAWNTASFTDGAFIHVPDNTIIDKPVVIYNINDASCGQVVTLNRNFISLGKSSEVTIIEKFDSIGNSPNFSNTVTEVIVSENAALNLYSIQNDSGLRYQFGHTHIHQSNFSRVNTFTFTLNGKLIRNNLHLSLDGEGIESHMYGLYLVGNDTLADNHTVVDHKKPNSYSNELYKGIMDGSSKGVFNGKIYVRPNAQKTNAFQANRNILLTDKAGVNTKPQLEIWADDVKCSHGCTTGQLDEEALFYLQTRGINKETAQAMMLYAFAGEVLENVKDPVIKEYLDTIISERLHKSF